MIILFHQARFSPGRTVLDPVVPAEPVVHLCPPKPWPGPSEMLDPYLVLWLFPSLHGALSITVVPHTRCGHQNVCLLFAGVFFFYIK